jgi:hypothetical protein
MYWEIDNLAGNVAQSLIQIDGQIVSVSTCKWL